MGQAADSSDSAVSGPKYEITLWPNLRSTRAGKRIAVSWEGLCKRLSKKQKYAGENEQPGWSPAVFRDAHRCDASVEGVTLLGLDFDHDVTLDDVEKFEFNCRGFLHTTRKHKPDAPRFRVVMPLSRMVSVAEHGRLWAIAAEKCSHKCDAATKDPSRFWFLPGSTTGCFETRTRSGPELDVDAWLAKVPERKPEADVAPLPATSKSTTGKPHIARFETVNAMDPTEIVDRLGIEREGRKFKCPNCGEGLGRTDCVIVRGGTKCSHNRCSNQGKNGFRTNVDLVMLMLRTDETGAVEWLENQLNILRPDNAHVHTQAQPPTLTAVDDKARVGVRVANDNLATGQQMVTGAYEEHDPQRPALPRKLGEWADSALAITEARMKGEDAPVPAPWRGYNEALEGGRWPGNEIIISTTGGLKSQLVIQSAEFAAEQGIPTFYATLELTGEESNYRVLAHHAGCSWADLQRGRCSAEQVERARVAAAHLKELPFYCEQGVPGQWEVGQFEKMLISIRNRHPTGPIYGVIDYLQQVASEEGNDLRQRVDANAYRIHEVAKRYGVATSTISSTARANYSGLQNIVQTADLTIVKDAARGPQRLVGNRSAIEAMGKESGSVEYSCESQLVMARWPRPLDSGDTVIVCATAKFRFGPCRWFGLAVRDGQLNEYEITDLSQLPQLPQRGAGRQQTDADGYVSRICDFVRANPDVVKSKTGFRKHVPGNKASIDAAAERLIAQHAFKRGPNGGFVLPQSEGQ